MTGSIISILILFGLNADPKAAAPEKPLWLAVTRKMFVRELEPLARHRKKDGLFPA